MPFVIYPSRAYSADLHLVDKSILIELLRCHFQWCKGDIEGKFHLSDRELKSLTGHCLNSITNAKKRLRDSNVISFECGCGNRTYYKILSLDGKPSK